MAQCTIAWALKLNNWLALFVLVTRHVPRFLANSMIGQSGARVIARVSVIASELSNRTRSVVLLVLATFWRQRFAQLFATDLRIASWAIGKCGAIAWESIRRHIALGQFF
jgi:hypothetical protein